MSRRAVAEVVGAAAVTAVVVLGLAGGLLVATDDQPRLELRGPGPNGQPAEVEVGGCKVTATLAPAEAAGELVLTVKATRTDPATTSATLDLVVEREAVNPLSRVVSASDAIVVWQGQTVADFSRGGQWSGELKVSATQPPAPAEAAGQAQPAQAGLMVSYNVKVKTPDGEVLLAAYGVVPPTPAQ